MTTEYSFRYNFTPDLSGFSSMELDRVIGADKSLVLPVVRFYTWEKPTISIGVNQNLRSRLKIGKCLSDGIEVVARPTGGREILHGWDLCCSVIWPVKEKRAEVGFRELFARINEILNRGLTNLGIDARTHSVTRKSSFGDGPCFSQIDRGEISVSGKKIVASAQRIFDRAILQQSSISFKRPGFDLMDYLTVGKDSRLRDGVVNSMAFINENLEETITLPEIVTVLKREFESELGKSVSIEMTKNQKDLGIKNKP